MSIKVHAYWSTQGTITATGTTTLLSTNASDCAYLCYGFVQVSGATTGKKVNLCYASATGVLMSFDTTAVAWFPINFGDRGWRCTSGAALYLIVDATHSVYFGLTGYQG